MPTSPIGSIKPTITDATKANSTRAAPRSCPQKQCFSITECSRTLICRTLFRQLDRERPEQRLALGAAAHIDSGVAFQNQSIGDELEAVGRDGRSLPVQ